MAPKERRLAEAQAPTVPRVSMAVVVTSAISMLADGASARLDRAVAVLLA